MKDSVVRLAVATIEKPVLSGEFARVSLPTAAGRISVRPGHQTLVGLLAPGVLTAVNASGEEKDLLVTGGFFEVRANSDVAVMADSADPADSLDSEEIRRAKERAERLLEDRARMSAHEFAQAETALSREIVRLQLAMKYRAGQ